VGHPGPSRVLHRAESRFDRGTPGLRNACPRRRARAECCRAYSWRTWYARSRPLITQRALWTRPGIAVRVIFPLAIVPFVRCRNSRWSELRFVGRIAAQAPTESDLRSSRPRTCSCRCEGHPVSALIRDAIVSAAGEEGYSVAVNAPFSGALVPLSSYRRDRRILSVMIEVNRRLYVDELSGSKNDDFEKVRAAVGRTIMIAAKAAAEQAAASA
jgi:N-formylglutamate amidohydrolase